ncbi:MAG: hypothetical protein KAX36_01075 [Thermoflexales bacterium]|nr:hypothetical protein [Thermoflexales bacterium]
MTQPEPISEDSVDIPVLEGLFRAYKTRHLATETWDGSLSLIVGVARRLKVDPFASRAGRLLSWVIISLSLLAPAVLLTSLTGTWASAMPLAWVAVALIWSAFTVFFLGAARRASEEMLSLHGALATERGYRDLIAWDRRWFSYPVVAAIAVGFAILATAVLLVIQSLTGAPPLHIGTLAVGAGLFYAMGSVVASDLLLTAEYPLLSNQTYRLFRPNPAQTLAIRRALRGYNQRNGLSSLFSAASILMFAILLPPGSVVLGPLITALFGLASISTAIIVVAPRQLMTTIVRKAKERELGPMQDRLNALWPRALALSPAESDELRKLEDIHAKLLGAPEDLLNVGRIVGRIGAALFLPALTTLISLTLQRSLFR